MAETPGLTVLDLAAALRECPELVEPALGSLVPIGESAGSELAGTFVHVAAGVRVVDPLQTFFGRDAERMSAHNRTLIVAEPDSSIEYIEGCSAPMYTRDAERTSVVEIVAGARANVRHTTIQNWSTNVNSTVTKHATVASEGHVEWVDAALGSAGTTTRLMVRLLGEAASASVLSLVSVGAGQHHDAEVHVAHEAQRTSSEVLSKLLGSDNGSMTSRHVLQMGPASQQSRGGARADTLRLKGDPDVRHTFTTGQAADDQVDIAAVDRMLDQVHVSYLTQRGLSQSEALGMVLLGFLEPIVRTLPMEYRVEWERAIQLGLDQAIG